MKEYLSVLLFLFISLLVGEPAHAQKSFKVSGTVTDTAGEPIAGVSVICPANKQGAITDAKENYIC